MMSRRLVFWMIGLSLLGWMGRTAFQKPVTKNNTVSLGNPSAELFSSALATPEASRAVEVIYVDSSGALASDVLTGHSSPLVISDRRVPVLLSDRLWIYSHEQISSARPNQFNLTIARPRFTPATSVIEKISPWAAEAKKVDGWPLAAHPIPTQLEPMNYFLSLVNISYQSLMNQVSSKPSLGIWVGPTVDEASLGLVLDYFRSIPGIEVSTWGESKSWIRTRTGLVIRPQFVATESHPPKLLVVPPSGKTNPIASTKIVNWIAENQISVKNWHHRQFNDVLADAQTYAKAAFSTGSANLATKTFRVSR